MKLDELYPSRWLKAADVDRPILATIKKVTMEEVAEGEDRPCLHFSDPPLKPMVLNRTNATTISGFLGDDTDAWMGKKIVLFSTKVQFQAKVVDAIRVRPPKPAPAPAPAPVTADDDVPF